MRSLVHLRHAERAPGGTDLTDRGRAAARRLGARLPRFDRVLTSPLPRAIQTAEAMGYPVDATLDELRELPSPAAGWFDREPPRSFADVVAVTARVVEIRENATALAGRWAAELDGLADGRRLLLVSHAGIVELGTAGALGEGAASWGAPLERLEGVELHRLAGRWHGGSPLRRVD